MTPDLSIRLNRAAGRMLPTLLLVTLAAAVVAEYVVFAQAPAQRTSPVVVVETTHGSFAFELYGREAPVSTAHIVQLVKSGFYDGQRVHRVLPGVLVQFGDPQSRDPEKRALWGKGPDASSGKPIGVAEVSVKRKHVPGAVGLAHMGEPAQADSQLYVMLDRQPQLDGQYAVIGRIIEGIDVPPKLQPGDQLLRVFLRE
jgi:cyclophilin family peptidyl-prolyl cis-trans isomerase